MQFAEGRLSLRFWWQRVQAVHVGTGLPQTNNTKTTGITCFTANHSGRAHTCKGKVGLEVLSCLNTTASGRVQVSLQAYTEGPRRVLHSSKNVAHWEVQHAPVL